MRQLLISLVVILLLSVSSAYSEEYDSLRGQIWSDEYVKSHKFVMGAGLLEEDFYGLHHLIYITKKNKTWYVWLLLRDGQKKPRIIKDLIYYYDDKDKSFLFNGTCDYQGRFDDTVIAAVKMNGKHSPSWYDDIDKAWRIDLDEHVLYEVNVKDVRCDKPPLERSK